MTSLRYMLFTFFCSLLMGFALTACLPAPGTPAPATAQLNQEFKLKVGQEIAITGEDLSVRFQSVLEDSRCPKSVQCVQAGQAKISLVMRRKNSDSPSLTLTINPPQAQNQVTYEGYEIQLKALNPYPEIAEKKIEPKDYEATLIVSKK